MELRLKFKIDVPQGPIRLTGEPGLTVEDLISVTREVLEHPDYRTGMSSIWDFRACSLSNLSSDDLFSFSAFNTATTRGMPRRRTAIVVDGDLPFGLSRMYEMRLEDPQVEISVFRIMEKAEDWISEGA